MEHSFKKFLKEDKDYTTNKTVKISKIIYDTIILHKLPYSFDYNLVQSKRLKNNEIYILYGKDMNCVGVKIVVEIMKDSKFSKMVGDTEIFDPSILKKIKLADRSNTDKKYGKTTAKIAEMIYRKLMELREYPKFDSFAATEHKFNNRTGEINFIYKNKGYTIQVYDYSELRIDKYFRG
jgi:hypothetical protein